MLTVFVEGFRAFPLTVFDYLREQEGDHVHADSTCTGNADRLQRQVATAPPDNLLNLFWDAVTETPNLSAEIDRRIRAGGMGFRRCTRELYEHPKTNLPHLKA